MKLITGVTGRTGSQIAAELLSKKEQVRVLVRNNKDANFWSERGAEIALGDFFDANSLKSALSGVDSAYIMTPPLAQSHDLMKDRSIIEANIVGACKESQIQHIVCLSAFGAHLNAGTGQIVGLHKMENTFAAAGINFVSLRAAYFMENWDPSIAKAINEGSLGSFIKRTDLQIEQVSTADIARCAIECLNQTTLGSRCVSVAGPSAYSAIDVAAAMSEALSREVNAVGIPEESWWSIWQGLGWTVNRCELYQEFYNSISSGLAKFDNSDEIWRGSVSIDQYVKSKLN